MTEFETRIHTLGISLDALTGKVAKLLSDQSHYSFFFDETIPENGITLVLTSKKNSGRSDEDKLHSIKLALKEILGETIWGYDKDTLPELVGELLLKSGCRVSTAESCTGGLLASLITDVRGASRYFEQGYITYSNRAKTDILGVRKETLEQFGAVSEETVREMSAGLLELTHSDYAIAVSGYSDTTDACSEKISGEKTGLVYISLANQTRTKVKSFRFYNERVSNKRMAAFHALNLLRIMACEDIKNAPEITTSNE